MHTIQSRYRTLFSSVFSGPIFSNKEFRIVTKVFRRTTMCISISILILFARSFAQSLLIMWRTMFKNLIGEKLKINERNISDCSSKLLTLFRARACVLWHTQEVNLLLLNSPLENIGDERRVRIQTLEIDLFPFFLPLAVFSAFHGVQEREAIKQESTALSNSTAIDLIDIYVCIICVYTSLITILFSFTTSSARALTLSHSLSLAFSVCPSANRLEYIEA